MHKPHSSFRKFSLRGLLVAGALASLGLPLGREAYGIGGSAIQPTYGPRDSIGAPPVISLIPSGPSSPSMVASSGGGETSTPSSSGSTRATRHVSSDDEGHGTTKKRRKRKTEEGEDEGTRVAKARRKGGGATTESKDYEESKEVKNAIIAPPVKPMLTLSTGFESRYIYHGVDIVGFNSGSPQSASTYKVGGALNSVPESNATSPILYVNGNIEFKGFHLGVGYIHAIDETTPSRAVLENDAAALNHFYYLFFPIITGQGLGGFTPFPKNSPFKQVRTYYQEVDLNTDYTLAIIANVLDATAGYNSYIIPNHEFKGTNYQGEAFGRLTYKQIPYIQPSITYYRYISDARAEGLALNVSNGGLNASFTTRKLGEYLNGNYVEARIDGAVPLIKGPDFSAAFDPYVLVSVNDGYLTKEVANTTQTEFNTFEVGAKLPMSVGGHFAITPYFTYGIDISRTGEANDFSGVIAPFKEDIYGGITFSYRF